MFTSYQKTTLKHTWATNFVDAKNTYGTLDIKYYFRKKKCQIESTSIILHNLMPKKKKGQKTATQKTVANFNLLRDLSYFVLGVIEIY